MKIDPEWPSFHDLMTAYKSCRIGKPANPSQIRFEIRLAENLSALLKEIHSGAYRPSPSKCFIVSHPRPREIFAADFRDRVVHHLVVTKLSPSWERKFIDGSFACRVGRGSHGAIRFLQKKVRQLSRGGHAPVFALQVDIEKFFVSIHRPTLCKLLLKDVVHPRLKMLVHTIYSHDARIGVKKGGNPSLFSLIPPGKSWFEQAPDKGIPIGNLTSQFGANVYLTALDHFVQRELKPAAYLRYMDDLLLLDHDPEKLRPLIEPIDRWLRTHRDQRLNPAKTTLNPLVDGIAYLGFRLQQTDCPAQPLQVFAEPLKKWRFVGAVKKLESSQLPTTIRPHRLSPRLQNSELLHEMTSVNSRLGSLTHAKSYRLRSCLTGAITVVQRFGSALNLNIHFHVLALDGVYVETSSGVLAFVETHRPGAQDVSKLIATVQARMLRALQRRGLVQKLEAESGGDNSETDESIEALCQGASVQYRLAMSNPPGKPVRRIGSLGHIGEDPQPTGDCSAIIGGYSIHAGTFVAANDRAGLERMSRGCPRG